MIKIIKKILGIINSIVLCFRFPFLYPRNRFSGKHEVYISWIMRLYNKLYKKSKDKFQLLFIFHKDPDEFKTGYISPYCDDCYQQYYKDKPYSVIKNWYGWTGSNIENKQVVS